jgi:hypothetical protein
MPTLAPGDIFCTANPMMLGRIIMAIERLNSTDNNAEYSHAGIIMGPTATTFEALWTNRRNGLFNSYAGKKVLIGRNLRMTRERYDDGWKAVADFEGEWYAFHRLILNLIPPLAKLFSSGHCAVCSELAAKFLVGAGLMEYWKGINPDHMTDMLQHYREWQIIFEGILPNTLEEFNALPVPETIYRRT